MHDAYLFNSLHDLLVLPYGSHYPQYPRWDYMQKETKNSPERTGDEIVDEFFGKLNKIAPIQKEEKVQDEDQAAD